MGNTIQSVRKLKGSGRPQKLVSEVQFARIRLARAESELKSSEEHLRVARRRRKEAKQAARRAKRNFKLARANVSEARQFLAETRAKLFKAGERAAETRKPARRSIRRPTARKKLMAKAAAARVRKAVRSRPVRRRRGDEIPFFPAGEKTAGLYSRRLLRPKPAARTASSRSKPSAKSASSVSIVSAENGKPIHVPRDFEMTPETVAPVAASQTALAGTKPQPPHV